MKAIQVTGDKSNPKITLTDCVPKPAPTGTQVLLKVHAAGITADELTWPELYASPARIPGHDVSGVVDALGPEYSGALAVGDEVYAMLRASAEQGGQAEYVVAAADEVCLKPRSTSHAQAAGLPIPVLTAWEAIHTHAKLERGCRVLVTGASGAVGLMLVQLARLELGAETVGLASPRNREALLNLGVSKVVDYNLPNWEDDVGDVDVVFDTVGGQTLARAWKTVKNGGAIVTVADPPPPWAFGGGEPDELKDHPGVKWVYFVVTARAEPLEKAASLLDEGAMEPIPVKVFGPGQGLEAWKYAAQRGREGKAVLQFVSDE